MRYWVFCLVFFITACGGGGDVEGDGGNGNSGQQANQSINTEHINTDDLNFTSTPLFYLVGQSLILMDANRLVGL